MTARLLPSGDASMLRIVSLGTTRSPAGIIHRLRLTGQVTGHWVEECRRCCIARLDAGDGLEIEMAEVSFVDAAGLDLFRELAARGVGLLDCSLFVAAQLKSAERDV